MMGVCRFQFDDGGRKAAGYKGTTGDCFVRAVAIATGLPYVQVYDLTNRHAAHERPGRGRKRGMSNSRTGVHRFTAHRVLAELGWKWTPTMGIGSGCRVHLRSDELPSGRLVVSVSKHYAAMIDGVVHDTFEDFRDGKRCVYGYWSKAEGSKP